MARVPSPVRGAQCATQAGIEGLATCLRQELRPRGVDVSVVAAGEFAAGTAWLSESTMLEQVNSLVTLNKYFVYGRFFSSRTKRKFVISLIVVFPMFAGTEYVESIECRTKT